MEQKKTQVLKILEKLRKPVSSGVFLMFCLIYCPLYGLMPPKLPLRWLCAAVFMVQFEFSSPSDNLH